MRAVFAAVAAACLALALACVSNAGPPPSSSKGTSDTRQSQPPCLGNTDGVCPSGNPMSDF